MQVAYSHFVEEAKRDSMNSSECALSADEFQSEDMTMVEEALFRVPWREPSILLVSIAGGVLLQGSWSRIRTSILVTASAVP